MLATPSKLRRFLPPGPPRLRRVGVCLIHLVLIVYLALAAATVRAQESNEPKPPAGKQWALLIGVEKYHRASRLKYTINDVVQLARTLRERGGVPENNLLQITDDESNPRYQPLRTSLMSELPRWLDLPEADDQVIVYFSGHGFRDAAGKMYLAPVDCDPEKPVETGIAVEWLREAISRCRAKFKLLVIDSCHAGSEKGEDDEPSVAAKDLGEPFRDLSGVITLASSTGDEKSQIWEEKQQSLYSYWLNQALKGHADDDGDYAVDVDELYNFVHRNVVRSAKNHFPRPQTPVRIVRSGVEGTPVVLRLKPLALKPLLADMADQLAAAVADQGHKRVAVLEFTNDSPLGELLGAKFGALGRYCSAELERRLQKFGEGQFTVVDQRRLQQALQASQFQIADLGSSTAMSELSKAAGGLPVMALGTLRSRAGRVITIQCKLIQTETGDLVGSVGGAAWIDESEWAMIGHSASLEKLPLPTANESPSADDSGATEEPDETSETIEQLDDQADGPHPLADPKFPYRVRLLVNGRERKGKFVGNDYYVPIKTGERYKIQVEDRSRQLLCMRLLVDGLNTLPQAIDTKGISTEEVAPRVNLNEARHWVLDPRKANVFTIAGFVFETGETGKLREFIVVDVDKSLAARQKFTDQIGLITAAFFLPKGRSRGATSVVDEDTILDLTTRKGVEVGKMLAVVNIRYVEPEEFERLK